MAYALLAILIVNHALSSGLRTVHTLMADGVSNDMNLMAADLGAFAGAYNITFAIMQIPVGIALDRYGPRFTCGVSMAFTAIGAAISAVAPTFELLLLGQAIIGAGCSSALMGSFVFTSNWFARERFAAISSILMSLGSVGIMATSTPLAILMEHVGWRGAFWTLAACAAFMSCLILSAIRDHPRGVEPEQKIQESILQAINGITQMFTDYRLLGILCIGLMAYPVKLTLRSVWVGPYFGDVHQLDAITVGNIVLVISLAVVMGPFCALLCSRFLARRWIVFLSVFGGGGLLALLPVLSGHDAVVDTTLLSLAILILGFYVLTFTSVRHRFPASHAGRALSTLNFSIFVGVALWQVGSGFLLDVIAPDPAQPDLASYDVMFIIMGMCTMISGIVYLFTRPKSDLHPSEFK